MTVEESEPYPYVIGIQFGNITSGVSVAHKDDALNIRTLEWESKTKVTQVPTCILYKDGKTQNQDSILFGLEVDKDIGANDIFLQHIKEYIYDPISADKVLNEKKPGLTAQTVISDYLRKLHKTAITRLTKKLKKTHPEFKEQACRYVVGCPVLQRDFMSACFIQAGIVAGSDLVERLDFVTQTEASAYNCIAWDRTTSKIMSGEECLVCDIGHTSFGMSRITAATTESLSTVKHIAEYKEVGSKALEDRFQKYLEENSDKLRLDPVTTVNLMNEFLETKSTFSFDVEANGNLSNDPVFTTLNADKEPINISYDELNSHVFSPVTEEILQFILKTDTTTGENEKNGYSKIFLIGAYSMAPYLLNKLLDLKYKKISDSTYAIDHYPLDAVSRGAVSHGFRKKRAQIPYFLPEENTKQTVMSNDPIDNKGVPEFNECDFIVGIDFGTTYSGSSYVRPARKGEEAKIKPIDSGWPGQGQNNMVEKAPTLIIYNENKRQIIPKWGQLAKSADLQDFEQLFGNFKLFLSPENVEKFYGKGNSEIREINDRFDLGDVSAVQVIAEYLKQFKIHVEKYIRDHEIKRYMGVFPRNLTLSYVLTVPAMWDQKAKDTMVSAAIAAGIVTKDKLHNLMVITEPEAAALYCQKHYEDFPKKNGMTFIVCDAGGGTVDLVTFRLSKPENGKEVIYQVGQKGHTCGSTYLDANFRDYIVQFYNDMGLQYDKANLKLDGLMNDFVDKYKPGFKTHADHDIPYRLSLPNYPKIPTYHNTGNHTLTDQNRTLLMPYKDMKEKVFDPIMDQIENLLDLHVNELPKTEKIDTILMVGGFSKSQYLQDRLKRRYEPDIKVGIPSNVVTAVSQGAVSYAQEPRLISKTLVVQSYALEVKAKFDSSNLDPLTKRSNDAGGLEFSESRLEYFVLKNTTIQQQEKVTVFEKMVYIEYPNNAVIAIFSCDDATAQRYVDDNKHNKIIEINVDMPTLPNKRPNDKIEFKIRLQLDHIGVTVSVECKDSEIGTTACGTVETSSLKHVRKSDPVVYRGKLSSSKFLLSK